MADEGKSGGKKIARLTKGDKKRTARHADVMNEIIDAINALYAMEIIPQGTGKLLVSDANVTLVLNTTECP
jgi:hypothetical protein